MKNILLLKADGVYRAIGRYIDSFAEAFRELGYNTITLDLEKNVYKQRLKWILENYTIHAVVDCQGGMFKHKISECIGKNITKMTFLCDHPLYHFNIMEEVDDRTVCINIDKKHTEYIRKYYPQVFHSEFIPLAGVGTDGYISYEDRKIDVIFAGTYEVPEEITLKPEEEGNFIARMHYDLQCILLNDPRLTMEEALEKKLELLGIKISEEEFAAIMVELCEIETNVRRYFRDKIIRTLLKEGVSLTVFGSGWDKLSCEGIENLNIMQGDYISSSRAMGNAKIVLNIMPWFKGGFQERIAAGMLSGAVVVTDSSEYIEEEFVEEENIVLYDLLHIEALPGKIMKILSEPKKAFSIAESGRKKAEERHTWKCRVRQMAEIIESMDGEVYEENTEKGQELPIECEFSKSFRLRESGLRISEAVKRFNELYVNGYANKADAQCLLDEISNINKGMQYELDAPFNINVMYETVEKKEYGQLLVYVNGILSKFKKMLRAVELEELLVGDSNYWNHELYDEMLVKVLVEKYSNSDDGQIRQWVTSIKNTGSVVTYPWKLINAYSNFSPQIMLDEKSEMLYVVHNGRKMYYPRSYTPEQVYIEYRFCCIEQDEVSTHRYREENFLVEKNSVIIDAGAAEGNFALDQVEDASKVYVIECDEKWIEALEHTFEPYKDKVVIITKMLGNCDDDEFVTIDGLLNGEKVDFIKMDVEGAEADALEGAKHTLLNNSNLKCVIATYHKKGMEDRVRKYLENYGYETHVSDGYLFYKDYSVPIWENEFRHALVRAQRKK